MLKDVHPIVWAVLLTSAIGAGIALFGDRSEEQKDTTPTDVLSDRIEKLTKVYNTVCPQVPVYIDSTVRTAVMANPGDRLLGATGDTVYALLDLATNNKLTAAPRILDAANEFNEILKTDTNATVEDMYGWCTHVLTVSQASYDIASGLEDDELFAEAMEKSSVDIDKLEQVLTKDRRACIEFAEDMEAYVSSQQQPPTAQPNPP